MNRADSAPWCDSDLSNLIATIQSGQRPYGGVTEDSGEIPSLGGENIRQGGGIEVSAVKKVSTDFFRSMTKGILADLDVLINKDGANTGKVGLYEAQFPVATINEHLFLLRGKSERLSQRFLYRILSSEDGQKVIRAKISGSAQPGLKSDFIRNFHVCVPGSTAEQSRIAAVLDAVDAGIAKTDAVIAKLKQVRAGLLDDLLTRGVDEHGQLRDPAAHPEQFQDSPLGPIPREWRVCGVLDVAPPDRQAILTGPFGAQLGQRDFVADGVPVLRIGNVQSGYIDWSDVQYVSSTKAMELKRFRVRTGDLLFARQGATTGRNALADVRAGGTLINYHIIRVAVDPDRCEPVFLHAIFNSEQALRQINRDKGRGTREGINTEQISSLRLALPSIEEQRRAAAVLANHDANEDSETASLAKLRDLKLGLMADLLTGRVRVPENLGTVEAG